MFLLTLKGQGDGNIENGDNLSLALVDVDIAVDGGDSQGLDRVAFCLCRDVAQLGFEVGFGPADAVLVNPVPKETNSGISPSDKEREKVVRHGR